MIQCAPKTQRALIRVAYWMPLITLLTVIGYALIPHLYFLFDGTAHETVSVFDLISNTTSECRALLAGDTAGSSAATFFAAIMYFCVILCWVTLVLYVPFALASAICSSVAFALPPTDPRANRAKRWMQFVCPNRPLFVLAMLLPLPIAFFPSILLSQYRNMFLYDMTLHSFGPPDLWLGIAIVAIGMALFLITLPIQEKQRMDLYRLYKSKKDQKDE